jgi:DNA-binding SARP family transcriptional activator
MILIDLYYKVGQPAYALRELDGYLKQLVASGRGARVVGILEDLVNRHPTQPGLVQRLVRLYLAQGRRQEAIDQLDTLGEAQLEAGENKQAITTIARIVELNPPNVASYQQLLKQLKAS